MATTPEQAIRSFVSLAKPQKGQQVADVITLTLKHPSTYLFGEMLELPSVKALAENEATKQHYDTLALFAYSTYRDYKANPSAYLTLEKPLLTKLKHLTVVTLSAKTRVLPYDVLLKELDLESVRELEDLLIDCMYQGLIKAKLDQKAKSVEVYEAIGRDIKEGEIPNMIAVLKKWVAESEKVLKSLEGNTTTALSTFEQNKKERDEFEKKVDEIKKNIKASLDMQNDVDMPADEDPRGGARRAPGGASGARGPAHGRGPR